MFKPELYQKSNTAPKIDALGALKEYSAIIKWKHDDTVIDLGCGDGALTAEVFKGSDPKFKNIVGCDVSEKLVQFANKNYGDQRTTFMVFDLGGELPNELKGNFSHAFSFYAIHWISKQEKVFSNIYNILKEDGDCLLVFPAYTPIHEFYRILSRHKKWEGWLTNAQDYISPYHESQEPEKEVRKIMERIGFKDIQVTCKVKSYSNDMELFKTTIEAICPFKIPGDLQEEFMKDYIEVVRDMELIQTVNGQPVVRIDYRLLVAYGLKETK